MIWDFLGLFVRDFFLEKKPNPIDLEIEIPKKSHLKATCFLSIGFKVSKKKEITWLPGVRGTLALRSVSGESPTCFSSEPFRYKYYIESNDSKGLFNTNFRRSRDLNKI